LGRAARTNEGIRARGAPQDKFGGRKGTQVAAWHRRYNVSGKVHCADRLDHWCAVLRDVLQLDDVSYISHMTGAVTIFAFSPIADVASSGSDVHYVHALAHGERPMWVRFVATLKSALAGIQMESSLMVHDAVETLL
jgi:hypothetical protein